MHPGGRCCVRSRGPELRPVLHPRQWPLGPQRHPALGHASGLEAVREDGARRPWPGPLRRVAVHAAPARGGWGPRGSGVVIRIGFCSFLIS